MKQFLLICGLLLCIANIGYAQNGGGGPSRPPRVRDEQLPTPNHPIGININHPTVLVWFTEPYGNVIIKVINSAGATITKNIYAVNGASLTIDTSALGQTYYKVYVTNKLGMVLTEF